MLRKCNICGKEAITIDDLELFRKDKKGLYGRGNFCKKCDNVRKVKWRQNNKLKHRETSRRHYIKYNYKISEEEYNSKFNSIQECEICGSTKRLHYDHNHNTGEFRGILCSTCNLGIGLLKDDTTVLKNAIKYIEERGSYSSYS